MPVDDVVFDPLFKTKHLVLEYEKDVRSGEAEAIYMEQTRHGRTPRVIIPRPRDMNRENPKDILYISPNTPSTSLILSNELQRRELEIRIKNHLNQNARLSEVWMEVWIYLPRVRFRCAKNMHDVADYTGGSVLLGGNLMREAADQWEFRINHLGDVRAGGVLITRPSGQIRLGPG